MLRHRPLWTIECKSRVFADLLMIDRDLELIDSMIYQTISDLILKVSSKSFFQKGVHHEKNNVRH